MTEPQADRYLRSTVWQLVRERPADFARATLARLGHFWSVAPAASVYSARRSLGDHGLDGSALARRRARAGPARPLALAADRRAAGRDRSDAGPRPVLDRPADAAPIVPAIALIAAGAACLDSVSEAAARGSRSAQGDARV